MSTLRLYHDFTSPFCRVAVDVAAEVADRLGLELQAVPFELRPAPAPLFAPDDPRFRSEIEAARPAAAARELAMEPPPRLPRTGKAHEAVAHARAAGAGRAMLRALYDALWRDGADIGRIDVIADLAESAGVEREPLHVALGVDERGPEVAADQRQADADGIDGVPSFRIGDRVLVGLVTADDLLAWAHEVRDPADP